MILFPKVLQKQAFPIDIIHLPLLCEVSSPTRSTFPRLSSIEVWNMVCDLPKFTYYGKACTTPGYGETHNWTKEVFFGT